MKTECKGTIWKCDGCGKDLVMLDNEPPSGFTGVVGDGYGNGWEWYACSRRCVTKAIWSSQVTGDPFRQEP